MLKKIAAFLLIISTNLLAVTIEKINISSNLEEDKANFIQAYSYLYKDITPDLKITNLFESLKKRFLDEIELIKQKKRFGLRAVHEGKVAAFISLKESKDKKSLHLKRCAIDLRSDTKAVVNLLIKFISVNFPRATSIATIVLKKSETEISLLKKFGFKECKLISDKYTPEIYTSFKLNLPL